VRLRDARAAGLRDAGDLGLWQIVTRFVIERPAEWTEVLIRFSLIWMVFMGIPLAFRIGAMVSVDVLYRWSGPRMRRVLDGLVALAALAAGVVIIVDRLGLRAARQRAERHRAGDVSMFWAYLAMPVGGVFSSMAIVGNWLDPNWKAREELETGAVTAR
jgi:TRAP-type C4-dicarboxylate transport system permease small subunit